MADRLIYDQQIKVAYQRLHELMQQSGGSPEQRRVIDEALKALSSSLDELHAAGEELYQQNEDLAAARQSLDAEREAAQATLEEERTLVSAVLDTTATLVTVLDREGRIVRFNRACEQATGYTADEVAGRRFWDFLLLPEEVASVQATFDDLRSGLFPNQFENTWVARDGSRRLIAWTNTAIAGPDGAVETVIGTGLDITVRRRAESQREAALEEIHSLARFPAENPNPIMRLDPAGAILYANQASAVLLGEWGCRVGDQVPPAYCNLVADAFAEGTPRTVDVPSGAQVYSFAVVPIAGAGYVNLYGQDVTARRQAEGTLRQQAELLDYAHVLIRDVDSRIVSWNKGAEELYGWTKDEAIGQISHALFQTHFPDSLAAYEAHLFGEGRWEGELTHTRRDGSRLVVASHHVLYRDVHGQPIRILEVNNDITALKQAESQREAALAALKESQARARFLADILERASQPFGMGYPDGRLGDFNAAYCDLIGYSPEEMPALDWATDLTPPEWRALEAQRLAELQRTGRPVRYEKEYIRKDGARVPVELLVHLVRDEAGAPQYYYSFITDITERKRDAAEREQLLEENRRQREFLEQLLETAPIGVAVVRGPEHRYEFANAAYQAFPGVPDTPMVGRTIAEVFPAAVAQGSLSGIEAVYRTGQTVSVREYESNAGPGREHTYWDSDRVPLKAPDGSVEGVLIVAREVTDRVLAKSQREAALAERERLLAQVQAKNEELQSQAEELQSQTEELEAQAEELRSQAEELHAQTLELDEERARLRAIIDSAPEAMLVADERGEVVLANAAAARLFAAPAGPGLEYYQRVARYRPDRTPYQPHEWPLFRAAVHRETEHDLPIALLWPDGQWRDVLMSAVPILDSRGQAHGAVAVYRDITERIQAEAERERLLAQTQRDRESLAAMAQILEKEWDTLQTIMESTHAQLAYLDPDFNFVRVNSAYAQGSGHSREELVGHNHFGLFPNAENQAIFEQVRTTGQPLVFHAKPFEFADQPERGVTYWDWTLVPVKEANGQVRGLVLSLLDVTQRVQAEQEREQHLARLDSLIRVSEEILAERTLEGLMQRIVDAARALTGATIGVSGHGFRDGAFRVGAASRAEGVPACPPGEGFSMQQGGVYRELIEGVASIRLTQEQLRAHPTWWGLPEGHAPLRGLLGARLVGRDGRANGLIMLSDKAGGGDFSAEDEALLAQLAALASLAAQHIEAQNEAERRADELDAVFAAINEAVVVHDAGGRVVRANPAANAFYGAEVAGADRAAIVQKLSIRHPDGTPVAPEAMAATRALHGEQVRGERFILTTPDGRDLTILVSAAPLAARGQASAPPAETVVVWHDVTERERLLEENRRQREFMERLVETAPVGVAVVRGPDHRYEFANPSYQAISGMPGTPVLGRTFAEVFPAVAAKGALSMVEAVYETGQTVGAREYEANVGPGREQTYWDVNCVPLKTAGGDVEEVLIVAHEVTEEVLARRQVEELAARDEAILNSLTEGVITVDLEGAILTMNPAALRILGWERVEQAPRRPQEYPAVFELRSLDGRVLPMEEWPVGRLLRGETFSGYEVQARRLDNGAILVGSYGGAPVRDAAGNVILGVLALRDVTAQKQAEEKIKAALAEKEVLMREIYHRVKNNLQALIYLMDMQADHIPDEATREMIRELEERARAMALVHEKLYQSHNLAQVDFGDYLHDLVNNLSRVFGTDRPIVWRVEAENALLSVDAAIPCGLVITELLTNALKYAFPNGQPRTERGETECAIGVEFRVEGERFTLVVADNGVGLPPGLDWTTTPSLGLQLINVLVRHQLGGQVEVDTQAGTAFKITFTERKKRE